MCHLVVAVVAFVGVFFFFGFVVSGGGGGFRYRVDLSWGVCGFRWGSGLL